ncbi:MAG TPA: glycoside hydrolase family 15 protein, partial [Polyangiaceae bacterium]
MPLKIEDYALIGDRETAALVGIDGSIDWLCLPHFDSAACFAALLGSEKNGRWQIRPKGDVVRTKRSYREGTLVLETEFETASGVVVLVDCMPSRDDHPRLVRMIEGRRGTVTLDLELTLRFDYGALVPWVRKEKKGLVAIAGPDAVHVQSDVPLKSENFVTRATFTVAKGERICFGLGWCPSNVTGGIERIDVPTIIRDTTKWWKKWSARARVKGPYEDLIERSLITLKALTHEPTGAVVAAPTTSLPEQWGGSRNWDYRYCWLRDATFTLYALVNSGYIEEAGAWRDWLLRAVAGNADQVKAMYSLRGERRVEEVELSWLPGYFGAKPVRVGNAVHEQLQLDIFGEVCDAFFLSARTELDAEDEVWQLQKKLVEFLETAWRDPDEGMWEVRGPRRDFTHSKVMAWVAFDRSVKLIEQLGLEGPVERWRQTRDAIHDEICRKAYDHEKRAFVQYYGGREVDATALLMPLVGFLPIDDPRVKSTIKAVESDLLIDGFVRRYRTKTSTDGLPPGEGCFLPCSFWLADAYVLQGRMDEARALFEKLAALANDVGLISEEYDPVRKHMLGNFPQAFTHVALLNTARNLSHDDGPARHRNAELLAGKRVVTKHKGKRLRV